jgi:hypothetical protein
MYVQVLFLIVLVIWEGEPGEGVAYCKAEGGLQWEPGTGMAECAGVQFLLAGHGGGVADVSACFFFRVLLVEGYVFRSGAMASLAIYSIDDPAAIQDLANAVTTFFGGGIGGMAFQAIGCDRPCIDCLVGISRAVTPSIEGCIISDRKLE